MSVQRRYLQFGKFCSELVAWREKERQAEEERRQKRIEFEMAQRAVQVRMMNRLSFIFHE